MWTRGNVSPLVTTWDTWQWCRPAIYCVCSTKKSYQHMILQGVIQWGVITWHLQQTGIEELNPCALLHMQINPCSPAFFTLRNTHWSVELKPSLLWWWFYFKMLSPSGRALNGCTRSAELQTHHQLEQDNQKSTVPRQHTEGNVRRDHTPKPK